MGVLGTMAVNFTANVQGLQSGIAMVSNGILDMQVRRKRQSTRRMLVAKKRQKQGKDVLQRHTRRRSRWTYLQFIRHVELNHKWALPHARVCMRNHRRIMREAQEPNHWSVYRR